jgi:benzodiazapine receptor
MKIGYILIPVFTLFTAYVAGRVSVQGIIKKNIDGKTWYFSLKKSRWNPKIKNFGLVWLLVYSLSCVSACMVYHQDITRSLMLSLLGLFAVNAILYVLWCYVFFFQHNIFGGITQSSLLEISIVGLLVGIWPVSRVAAGLLLPYGVWVLFVTFLNVAIYRLNEVPQQG